MVETSSTSSSENSTPVWRSKALAIVVTALALVLVVDRLLVENDEPARSVDFADRLTVQPSADGVYLLGNSMFKTGIDPDLLAEDMGSITPVDFEYHNGHYTNLWYLISRAALGQTPEQPRVVVWGFRPRFAAIPAFRQNTENTTDLFSFEDELFDRQGYLTLFDAIGSTDKRIHANPGLHPEIPSEEVDAAFEFLAARLHADVPRDVTNPLAE